ncbi:MAG: hypothetical protein LC798_07495 [Chloroflexi bacterium]|nr:hypothetical protein [Chloroflexota bacterium]
MTCRRCNLPITWVRTVANKAMPIDPAPSIRGNITMTGGRAMVLTKPEVAAAREQGRQLYVSHFATCPRGRKARS